MRKIPKHSRLRPKNKTKVRDYSPHHPNPCRGCSECCEYVALEIDTPTSMEDFDNIFWFLLHEHTWVYINEDGEWYLQFDTKCTKLKRKRCTYYEQRPQMCRDHHPAECVTHGKEPTEKIMLKNEEDLWEYLHYQRPVLYKKMVKKYGLDK